MKPYNKIFLFVLLSLVIISCSENDKAISEQQKTNTDEVLIKVNKYMIKSEDEEIDNFVKRRSWNMIKTGTGLRYEIFEQGAGEKAAKGDIIDMKFETKLITGDIVYSSDEDGIKSFVVGHGGVESGLEEAVLNLKKGDKAHIILPSHLAFGLLGDQKRIPSRSTLIYNVEILNIRK